MRDAYCTHKRAGGIALLLFIFCVAGAGNAHALDWVPLHEKAYSLSLQDAAGAAKKNSSSFNARYVLGLVYLEHHEDQDARRVFEEIIREHPDIDEARWGIAEVLRREHKEDEAVTILDEIVARHEAFSPARISLGYIQYIQRDFEAAAANAAFVINQGKKNVDLVNFVRAHCLYAGAKGMIAHFGGPLSKALNGTGVMNHLNAAQALLPNEVAVLFGIGSYYLLIPSFFGRDPDKAIEYLERAVKVDPLFADAYVRLAQAYKLKGNSSWYQENLDKALQIDPKNPLALDVKNGTCQFICVTAPR